MKSLELPDPKIDDRALLDNLPLRGVHNEHIAKNKERILEQYLQYKAALRAPIKNSPPIDPALKAALMAKYTEGRAGKGVFSYIESRAEDSARSCPYCGRSGLASTADHYLPEAHFPWFAVLSCNLVPSCQQCQNAKGDRYGPSHGIRPFHPIVDRFGDAHMLLVRPMFRGEDLAAVTFQFGSIANRHFRRKERKKQKHLFDRHRAFFHQERKDVITACRSALTDIRIKLGEAIRLDKEPSKFLRGQLIQVIAYEDHVPSGPLHAGILRALCLDPHAVRQLVGTRLPERAKTKGRTLSFLKAR